MEKISKSTKIAVGISAAAVLTTGLLYLWRRSHREAEEDKAELEAQNAYEDPGYGTSVMVTKVEAETRKKILEDSEIMYFLGLALPKGKQYMGKIAIIVELKSLDFKEGDLFIDFQGKSINSFLINQQKVDISKYFNNQRITLFKEYLIEGHNKIEITFTNLYRNTGTGLHKFTDPADNGEYLYTQFEPFHAHRAFPCFDQPDIKARMRMSILAPSDHVTLSNTMEESVISAKDDKEYVYDYITDNHFDSLIVDKDNYTVTQFKTTQKISSYLFAIIAGPYDIVEKEGHIPGKDEPIRMRFMCRQSIKEYIQQAYDDMHEAVVTGIKWYSEFFGTSFPWDKYDQIFCPEFKYGAMENVGAVTFSEAYIPTGKLTETHLTRLQNTCLHELCHQWFGNLCTMKWWDDLWLNEAFATYMAYLCTAENEKLFNKTPGMWITLNSRKVMASNSDSLSTTHPIKKEALTTDSADDMVNSITYGKGSSFIKQCIHMISKEAMSKACQIYFSTFAWKNSVLDDFINALIQGCQEANPTLDIDIRNYCIDFLTTKGINNLSSKVEQHGDDVQVTLTQRKGIYSDSLNMQKIDIQLYDNEMNFEQHSIILEKNAKTQTVTFKNRKANDTYVLLNADDHAYILIDIEKSFIEKFIQGDLCKINSSINRTVVWRGLSSMVRNLELKPMEYIEIVMNNIFKEDDIILCDTILANLQMFINTYVPDDKFLETCAKLFDKLFDRYTEIPESRKDLKNVIKSALFGCIYNEDHIRKTVGWLEDDSMDLLSADKETILCTMFRSSIYTTEEKQKALDKYTGDSATDRIKRLKITCQTCLPDKENKAKMWEIITHPKEHELSSYDYRAYLEGFHSRFQIELNREYVEKYLVEIPKFARSGEKDHMSIFVSGAFPPLYYMNQEFFDKVDAIIAEFENEDKVKHDSFLKLIKSIKESKKGQVEIKRG